MSARHICLLILSAVILSGCHSNQIETVEAPAPEVPITSDNLDQIAELEWVLQTMVIEGQEYALTDARPYIRFEDNLRLSGFASVNRLFGSIQIDLNGAVTWSPVGTTRMAGPIESMNQETIFLSILQQTKAFSRKEAALHTETSNPETYLVFTDQTIRPSPDTIVHPAP